MQPLTCMPKQRRPRGRSASSQTGLAAVIKIWDEERSPLPSSSLRGHPRVSHHLACVLTADELVEYRAPTILSACMDRVGLIERYVSPLVAELEEELRRDPGDSEVADNLAWLRGSLERTRAGG